MVRKMSHHSGRWLDIGAEVGNGDDHIPEGAGVPPELVKSLHFEAEWCWSGWKKQT